MDLACRRSAIRFLSYALGFFLLACVRWITNSFGSPSIQQLIFHLHFLKELITQTDRIFLVTFVVECLLVSLIAAGAALVAERAARTWLCKDSTAKQGSLSRCAQLIRWAAIALPQFTLVFGAAVFAHRYSVFPYLASRFGEDRFAQLYVDPAKVQLRKGPLKNLILIYVESLERTYSDKAIFGANLLERLDAIPGTSFESYVPAPGTGWTIAAMVGTQCGVPLQFVTRLDDMDMENGEHIGAFLPGAVCLPDILHRFGYTNVFLGGASLSYAGKGKFLSTHHYDEAYGYREWRKLRIALNGYNAWGLYDDDLFRVAKEKLIALHSAGVPFNLTLLTIDTHHPEGFYSTSCRTEGDQEFQTIVRCVSGELAEFVSFLQSRGYSDDTNIVIIGDHLAMPNPVYSKLLSSPHRKIFNKFISTTTLQKSTDEILPFDLFPTVLEYIGIQVDGQRLALGRSGVLHSGAVWPQGPRMEASSQILNFSRRYEELWTAATSQPTDEKQQPLRH